MSSATACGCSGSATRRRTNGPCLPTWTIIHSRCWKAQIPYLARHFRVLTFDPRGNGRSDRPPNPRAYAETEFTADALAVMDATGTDQAVLVSLSRGAQRALLLAADHPERVLAAAFIGPFFPASPLGGLRWRIMAYPRLLRAFFTRPPIAAAWGLETNAETHALRDFISTSSFTADSRQLRATSTRG